MTTEEIGLAILSELPIASTTTLNLANAMRGAGQRYQAQSDGDDLARRISDAYAWLIARGFIGPALNTDGWMRVTAAGRAVAANADALASIKADERLWVDLKDALVSARSAFERGEYEVAAFTAMRQIEVRVRLLAGASKDLLGVKLTQAAFGADETKPGPLTDTLAERGEQVAMNQLFSGAIGLFKNPPSHRQVDYDDPAEAAEIILLANLLMRLLDKVERRIG